MKSRPVAGSLSQQQMVMPFDLTTALTLDRRRAFFTALDYVRRRCCGQTVVHKSTFGIFSGAGWEGVTASMHADV